MADRNEHTIAYVVPVGAGLETFVYREIEALHDMGYRITLFATKYRKGDVFEPREDWPCYIVTPARLLSRLPRIILGCLSNPRLLWEAARDKALIDLLFALNYAHIMRRIGARQIHCHHGDHKLFIGYYCKRLTGLPLSVTIHAAEFYTNPNPVMFRKALQWCDRVFPISERWCKLLEKDYGVPASHIRLNRLFVDTSSYKPSKAITVLSVGRFTERKGFHYLLQAARLLDDLDIRFCFVGFGEYDIKTIAQELGVGGRVTLFRKMDQDELRFMFQVADILCVPSITTDEEGAEGIPVVLMEGMSCGLPVVATRCGATDEIVEEFLVDERSPQQLAGAIRRLAEDPGLRAEQGARNRQIVEEKYSVSNVRHFAEGLDEIVAGDKETASGKIFDRPDIT